MRFLSIIFVFAGTLVMAVKAAPVEALPLERTLMDPRAAATQCGEYHTFEEYLTYPLHANGHYENIREPQHVSEIINHSCGICMVFAGRDAQGDVLWSGGPGQGSSTQVRGGQSYFCIFGKRFVDEALEAINKLRAVSDQRDTSAACGTYTDKVADHPLELLVNGKTYENVALGTHMINISNISCGICMTFKGRDATGEITWSGGPGQGAGKEVVGSQSYFCIYGKMVDHTVADGHYIDSRPLKN